MHADPTVRAVASEVLRRFIRAFPSRRNEVLVGMAAFAAKIPDEFPEVRDSSSSEHILPLPVPRPFLACYNSCKASLWRTRC